MYYSSDLPLQVLHIDNLLSVISVNISSITDIAFIPLNKQSKLPYWDIQLSKHEYNRDLIMELLLK